MTELAVGRLAVDLQTRRITATDPDGGSHVWKVHKVRTPSKEYGRAWSIVFLEAARALARAPMPPSATCVLWWALGNLHPVDWTLVRHDQIAAELGQTRSGITKALLLLQARGLIERGDRGMLRIGLFFAWQGTTQSYQKAKRERGAGIIAAREIQRALAVGEDPTAQAYRMAEDPTIGLAPRERKARLVSADGAAARPAVRGRDRSGRPDGEQLGEILGRHGRLVPEPEPIDFEAVRRAAERERAKGKGGDGEN